MIPVAEPYIGAKEKELVLDCLKTNWISSHGKYIELFESKFSGFVNARHGIATTNGTTALHLGLLAAGIGKGDEVILPSFTMIASADAIVYCGAKPVLVDADSYTWNMDVNQIKSKLTKRTKAIMPVHIYGHPVDMDPVLEIAEKHGLMVIEDAAEAHGAKYKGKVVGCLGDVGCFSFYANKIITTGEGGMVVTNNEKIAEKARNLKNLSFDRERRYVHEELGYNYRMTNIQAAIGVAQMENVQERIDRKRRIAAKYNKRLGGIAGITTPPEASWAYNVYWVYNILIGKEFGKSRDETVRLLERAGIQTRFAFRPMNRQPVFNRMGWYRGEQYPVAEDLGERGFYIPSGIGISDEDIGRVCDAIERISRSK